VKCVDSEGRDRSHDLRLLIRLIRRRVLHHRDPIAELGGIANGRLDAGVRDQPDDHELMDPVLIELQIQIGVDEAAGTPTLRGDIFALSPGSGLNSERSSPPTSISQAIQCCIRFIDSADIIMLVFRSVMIQSDPTTTRNTMSTPNASARTLLVLSGAVVMCRKKTK
jgi:hypothetical protein